MGAALSQYAPSVAPSVTHAAKQTATNGNQGHSYTNSITSNNTADHLAKWVNSIKSKNRAVQLANNRRVGVSTPITMSPHTTTN